MYNVILRLLYSGFGDPRMISAGLMSLDISFLGGNMFRQITMSRTIDIVIYVVIFYGMEWHPHLTRSLIVWMDC